MEPLASHSRRDFLAWSGLAAASWLTPLGRLLAEQAEHQPRGEPAQSVILLWLSGGPSQLETFDPHPGKEIAAGTTARRTSVPGVQIASGFEQLADLMQHVALVRSVTTKEGDHERGTYLMKSGHRPQIPSEVHPSLGAIVWHELGAGKCEIPPHVSILPGPWPARGGFLGDRYDAFKCGDPADRLPDVIPRVPDPRDTARVKDLDVLERTFARGREGRVGGTLHRETFERARVMMGSAQLTAFDVSRESAAVRASYGDTPFGRGCLAARRLIEVGVRCVEVTLTGWDSHADNHAIHRHLVSVLDPAFSGLLRDLKERDLLRRTVVLCMGEFGRTPRLNRLAGRDHWTNGFSVALAGGGIRGGQVLGETDPEGNAPPAQPCSVGRIYATVLKALGIDPEKENTSPARRPIRLAAGEPLEQLLERPRASCTAPRTLPL